MCLVLDPKTVCVEASEVYQMEQMDKLGMEVIPVDLRDAYAFGGGLHCCTADVYREGVLRRLLSKSVIIMGEFDHIPVLDLSPLERSKKSGTTKHLAVQVIDIYATSWLWIYQKPRH